MKKKAAKKKSTQSKARREYEEKIKRNRAKMRELAERKIQDQVALVEGLIGKDSIYEQAMKTGLADSTIRNITTRKTRNPSSRTMMMIAQKNGKKFGFHD